MSGNKVWIIKVKMGNINGLGCYKLSRKEKMRRVGIKGCDGR